VSESACPHDDLEVGSRVDQIETPEGEKYLLLKLGVRCGMCGEKFSFAGLPSGLPNPKETVVSADGYELRAAIYPRPGATVGLMRDVGMEDEFVERLRAAAAAWQGETG
jgi:hypothetical protein